MDQVIGHKARLEVTGLLGEAFDKALEQAEAESNACRGGAVALREIALSISKLGDLVRKERDEEKFDGLDGAAVAETLQRYIKRAVECCLNLSERKKVEEMIANGKAAAFRSSVALAQSHHNASAKRLEQLLAPPETTEPEGEAKKRRKRRRPGEHPGASPLDRRRAKAKT